MIYFKWVLLLLVDLVLLLFTVLPCALIVSALTRPMEYKNDASYTWGWLWGTYDNPPQGDEGYVRKECLFPGVVTGWKGYLNRVNWMFRNNLYGYAKLVGLKWDEQISLVQLGNPKISDKYGIPGWYFVRAYLNNKLVGFEFYCVLPWAKTRDFRCRLGWKIDTEKFKRFGFAQFVGTANPFDGYGPT